MPKASLTYSLPEEEQEHLDAVNGTAWKLVVWNIRQELFRQRKANRESLPIDEIFEIIQREVEAKGLPDIF
jgi:hypothetical protein